MKYLKIFEDYFDKESLWTEPEGDKILIAFDKGEILDTSKEVKTKPTYRHNSSTTETTYNFKISKLSYQVQLIESETRGRDIIITRNGSFTDIPRDSPYREEILKRCEETIN
jgi:hypothetical protein